MTNILLASFEIPRLKIEPAASHRDAIDGFENAFQNYRLYMYSVELNAEKTFYEVRIKRTGMFDEREPIRLDVLNSRDMHRIPTFIQPPTFNEGDVIAHVPIGFNPETCFKREPPFVIIFAVQGCGSADVRWLRKIYDHVRGNALPDFANLLP